MKEINKIVWVLLSIIIFQYACTPDEREYFDNNTIQKEEITGIYLYRNHYKMLADGRAEVEFKPILLKGQDSIVVLDDRIDNDWIEFTEVKHNINVGRYFSTENSDLIGDTIKVCARVKGTDLVTDTVNVRILEPLTDEYEEIVYPVVFHVLQTKGDVKQQGGFFPSTKIYRAIERLNNVFGGIVSKNANGVDTKIRFLPALYGPDGSKLAEPGINRLDPIHKTIGYGKSNYEWFIRDRGDLVDPKDIKEKGYVIPEEGNKVLWPHDKYMQIWLISDKEVDHFGNDVSEKCYPQSKYSTADISTMPKGLKLTRNETNYWPGALSKGLKLQLQDFNSDKQLELHYLQKDNDWMYYIGIYFGLLPNYKYGYTNKKTDYCSDTFWFYYNPFRSPRVPSRYNKNRNVVKLKKYTSGSTYEVMCENIMDDPACLHRSITKEQAIRIRWIVENCPERQAWKSDFAFTGIGD
ncbi:MAG: hypothetical protein N4A71_22225 [Carboxylicivirga sp.]|nr:hypothetical protein [Carboxylicivirga sp.]